MDGLLDYLRDYGSGVKQRFGLLADNPAEFTRQALLDVVPNRDEALAAQARLMGGQVDPQAYQSYMNKMQDIGGLLGSIRVYHGSPHKFDKFDLSKIGAGEGNQTFGNGLYFAENPAVAEGYARDLAMRAPTQSAKEIRAEIKRVKAEEPAGWLRYEQLRQLQADLKSIRSGATREPQLYEANLRWPDAAREAADPMGPQHFLDWDKPLGEQPALLRLILQAGYERRANPELTGGEFASRYMKEGFAPYFSDDLARQGIPGIRYLDAGSRGAGQGTSNYVVFDDALIDILTRNGIPVKK